MSSARRPSLALFMSEPGRAIADYGAMLATSPALLWAPRGDGHPVLVMPGLLAEDASTATLRFFLRSLGYEVDGWHLGRNLGPTPEIMSGMAQRLEELSKAAGRTISLIGWSLGGVYARELARSRPSLVRQVITLSSPFGLDDLSHSRVDAVYQRLSARHMRAESLPRREALRRPLPVPTTAIFSRLDGVVPWQACINAVAPRSENVGVYSSHLGMGHNPAVLWVVADRLALAEGAWHPFKPPSLVRHLFPDRGAAEAA
jgi:pimeloyl-ACP methyl ester carboxylesterase